MKKIAEDRMSEDEKSNGNISNEDDKTTEDDSEDFHNRNEPENDEVMQYQKARDNYIHDEKSTDDETDMEVDEINQNTSTDFYTEFPNAEVHEYVNRTFQVQYQPGSFVVFRISHDPKTSFIVKLMKFVNDTNNRMLANALILGPWDNDDCSNDKLIKRAISLLTENAQNMPNLTGLYIGDMNVNPVLIKLTSLAELLPRLTSLQHLRINGTNGLEFALLTPPATRITYASLRSLIIQGHAMSSKLLRAICQSNFPSLEKLELWLGSFVCENWQVDDLQAITPSSFPRLTHLGLRNAEETDSIVGWFVTSLIYPQIEVLDISLGDLTDAGLQEFSTIDGTHNLRTLDFHHHFCSTYKIGALKEVLAGVQLNCQDARRKSQQSVAIVE